MRYPFKNLVFVGGGVKGIAYVGALQVLEKEGITGQIDRVGGTSAGAITASLIACGLDIEKLDDMIPEVLKAAESPIPVRLGLAAVGRATSLFDGAGLRRWLDGAYDDALRRDPSAGPVTFAEMYESTRIELYVVSLDLATEHPIVFNHRTTPTVDVAGAVAASSAIPGAFPAGRVMMQASDGGARVHQMIDGAGWANYPEFVFTDDGFRTWLAAEAQADGAWTDAESAAWQAEEDRPVVGFVLGEPDPPAGFDPVGFVPVDDQGVDRRFDLGPTMTSSARLTHLIGVALSSDVLRFIAGLALLVWVTLSVATLPIGFRRFSTWLDSWLVDPLYPVVLVGCLTVAVLAVVSSIVLIAGLLLVSRLLADTVLPAVKTVLGTPSEVPPWIGLDRRSVVLRVPRRGLSLIGFDVEPDTVELATCVANAEVRRQLEGEAGRRLDTLLAGAAEAPVELPPHGDDAASPSDPDASASAPPDRAASVRAVVVITVATAVVGTLAWWVTTAASSAGILLIVAGVVLAVVGAAVAIRVVGEFGSTRAHGRAAGAVSAERLPRPPLDPRIAMLVGVVLIGGGIVWSVAAMQDRRDDTVTAQVVEATADDSDPDADNRYTMRVVDGPPELEGATFEILSSRHLRLDERAFVGIDENGEPSGLTGALDDVRFAVSVVLVALGAGALTSGIRTRRWLIRNERLAELTAEAGRSTKGTRR